MLLDDIDQLIIKFRDRFLPAQDTAPHEVAPAPSDELKPDVAIGDPRTFRNRRGTKEKLLRISGQADKGIQAPIRKQPPGLYPMTPSKKGYVTQKVTDDE